MLNKMMKGLLIATLGLTVAALGACGSSKNDSSGTGGVSGNGDAGTGGSTADASGGTGGEADNDAGADAPADETGSNSAKAAHLMLINADTTSGIDVTRPMPTVDYNVCRQ